ncbi:thioredoxin-dependent thiol peroxidase [Caldisericum exile]|uniref:thioredoxin-dependent peroxiredoxin n=1 Tax=Caldisericum exile (strain DSM 21853 / NBRC 104410 / AZM16c01) TaxID=511051 RepID=A0A7U6GE67_CALEA|nr:thioredoxin-dependent thiol peroxidase [Caldisericum exile]BAL80747.1 peroxiredoxin [Caldisericum exile AZM16c01]
MVEEGKTAPDFELRDSEGNLIKLSNFKGKIVILYFYPKALTSGCTKEAQDFRDHYEEIKKLGAEVIGISGDKVEIIKKFKEKESLPFILLEDEGFKVSEEYGVYKQKSMYGKKYMGIERSTFIIDENGIVRKAMRKVKVPNHVKEVIEEIKKMRGEK